MIISFVWGNGTFLNTYILLREIQVFSYKFAFETINNPFFSMWPTRSVFKDRERWVQLEVMLMMARAIKITRTQAMTQSLAPTHGPSEYSSLISSIAADHLSQGEITLPTILFTSLFAQYFVFYAL